MGRLQPRPRPTRNGRVMNIHEKRTRGLSRFREVRERGNGSKMAALKEEQCYGLSCGRVSNGSNISVFHVKFTDTALKTLEEYQSSKVTVILLFLTIISACCCFLRGLAEQILFPAAVSQYLMLAFSFLLRLTLA